MAALENDTSRDEEIARQLQAQYDQGDGQAISLARPVTQLEMQLNCSHCGITHVVRNVSDGSRFQCARCNAENQISIGHRIPIDVYVTGGCLVAVWSDGARDFSFARHSSDVQTLLAQRKNNEGQQVALDISLLLIKSKAVTDDKAVMRALLACN